MKQMSKPGKGSLQRGASLTSYGLIVGLISVFTLLAIDNIGSEVKNLFDTTSDSLAGITPGNGAAAASPSPDICDGSPASGTLCGDGTVYVANTPDGSVPMFTTRCDAGQSWDGSSCSGSRLDFVWGPSAVDAIPVNCSNGSYTEDTCRTGQANTALLASLSGTYGPADHCASLSENGHDDWYLPAILELHELREAKGNGVLAGTFDEADGFPSSYLWSSSEADDDNAFYRRLVVTSSPGVFAFKSNSLSFRCVRHD